MRSVLQHYKYRLKRRRYLWRAFRARRQLQLVHNNLARIAPEQVLLFAVMRNEALRLPHFLDYYRKMGIGHFLIVDNGSTDTTAQLLQHPDITLWHSTDSYRAARFGVDWLNWLLMRHGTGHWCLSVDADELFIYPHHDRDALPDFTRRIEADGHGAYGAVMLDMFPRGPLDDAQYDNDPIAALPWFDAGPFRQTRQPGLQNLWLQGGTRDRVFFADTPRLAPTLNKIPLVKWRRSYAYVNSTHSMLPRDLNHAYDGPGGACGGGALMHSKFLPDGPIRAKTEQTRGEHFGRPESYAAYYDALTKGPDLWHPGAILYKDWRQLYNLNIISDRGDPELSS